ncbi:hypothetical protein ANACOL_03193 [Anaerotruncus colihominis DSM 17241]|uniref:Uncharacterized protein n=1 Tax=Anaerotruncus colihominis DSM 17241 TaxID=445972 RepID=B0PDN9_9FIRM|nr:hypothetical protein ANACOL_03193 [Anaerotruncus colihominis DSM 17241]
MLWEAIECYFRIQPLDKWKTMLQISLPKHYKKICNFKVVDGVL